MFQKLNFTLTDAERAQIERAMNQAEQPDIQRRAQAIWMLSQGHPVTEITQMLNVKSRTTIYNLWHRFKETGLEGLADRPRSGRPLKADENYCERLEAALAQKPQDLGYSLSEWTVAALRHYMQRETDLTVSEDCFRALLHRLGYRYGRVRVQPVKPSRRPRTMDELQAWLLAMPVKRDRFVWHK